MKLYNTRVIAHVLNLTESRIRQLRDEKVITEKVQGHYELIETIHAYIGYIRNGEKTDGEKANLKEEQTLYIRAKRQAAEYDLKLISGEVHYAQDVERIALQILTNFKQRLLGMPAKLSKGISEKSDPNDIQEILSKEIKEILGDFSDFGEIANKLKGED